MKDQSLDPTSASKQTKRVSWETRLIWWWSELEYIYHSFTRGRFYITAYDVVEYVDAGRPIRELVGDKEYACYSTATRKVTWTLTHKEASVFSGLATILFVRKLRKQYPKKDISAMSIEDVLFLDRVFNPDAK